MFFSLDRLVTKNNVCQTKFFCCHFSRLSSSLFKIKQQKTWFLVFGFQLLTNPTKRIKYVKVLLSKRFFLNKETLLLLLLYYQLQIAYKPDISFRNITSETLFIVPAQKNINEERPQTNVLHFFYLSSFFFHCIHTLNRRYILSAFLIFFMEWIDRQNFFGM